MGCATSSSLGTSTSNLQLQHMEKSEKVMKAALLIQRWYRRYCARLEGRRRYSWKIFQSMEYSGEQDQLKLYNFFNSMLDHFQDTETAKSSTEQRLSANLRHESDNQALIRRTHPDLIDVEPTYKGPRIQLPLDRGQIENLIDAFKRKQPLHAKYVLVILHEVRRVLMLKENISHASTSVAKQITVCGDLHGKIDDLFMIFYKNGLPSADNPYVFNGDFVDRGPYSVEIAMILFSLLIVHPDDVFINRGNHEDHIMNVRYGFVKEVINKYGNLSSRVARMFEEVFSWLPLAAIIDNRILVAHGGLSNKTDLQDVLRLQRNKYKSALKPPFSLPDKDSEGSISDSKKKDLAEWRQMLDLLWSDPKNQLGCSPNTFRGGGCYFGMDVTMKVLEKHGLLLLIRSHECKPDGYEYTHNNKVLTIFSASNYYGEGSNNGAYIKFDNFLTPHIVQFSSKATKGKRLSSNEKISLAEETALNSLREKIYSSKTLLLEEFRKHDPKSTKCISLMNWCNAMAAVLNIDLPWRALRPKLSRGTTSGMILYESTFDKFKVQNKLSQSGPSVTETLYCNRDRLGTIFRLIDRDNSGQLSMDEFQEACEIMSRHADCNIPKEQVQDIAKSIDINKDGYIDFNEFLEAFRLVSQEVSHDQISVDGQDTSLASNPHENGTAKDTSVGISDTVL